MQRSAQWAHFASTARRTRVYEHCAQQDSHKLPHGDASFSSRAGSLQRAADLHSHGVHIEGLFRLGNKSRLANAFAVCNLAKCWLILRFAHCTEVTIALPSVHAFCRSMDATSDRLLRKVDAPVQIIGRHRHSRLGSSDDRAPRVLPDSKPTVFAACGVEPATQASCYRAAC